MTYDARADLMRQISERKATGQSYEDLKQRLINIDRIPKKSKKPRVTTP